MNTNKKYFVMFLLLFLLCNFQTLTVHDFGAFSLQGYHVFSIVFIPFCLKKNTFIKPPIFVGLFIFYLFFSSFVNAMFNFSLSSLFFNYIYAFYILLVILCIGNELSYNQWNKLLKIGASIFMITVFLKNIIEHNAIERFFSSPYGHPTMYYFNTGGANLEATWLGIYGFFWGNHPSKYGMVYNLMSITTSITYASRCGLLINGIWLLWILLSYLKNPRRLFILIAVTVMIFSIISNIPAFNYIISRFSNIGHEAGSMGRINMWIHIQSLIEKYPFGVGIGNSITALETITSTEYLENNLHNLYLQMFVDLGIIGGVLYLFLIIRFFFKECRNYSNPIVMSIFVYMVICLLQFRGAETMFIIILGVYLSTISQKDNHKLERKI